MPGYAVQASGNKFMNNQMSELIQMMIKSDVIHIICIILDAEIGQQLKILINNDNNDHSLEKMSGHTTWHCVITLIMMDSQTSERLHLRLHHLIT